MGKLLKKSLGMWVSKESIETSKEKIDVNQMITCSKILSKNPKRNKYLENLKQILMIVNEWQNSKLTSQKNHIQTKKNLDNMKNHFFFKTLIPSTTSKDSKLDCDRRLIWKNLYLFYQINIILFNKPDGQVTNGDLAWFFWDRWSIKVEENTLKSSSFSESSYHISIGCWYCIRIFAEIVFLFEN